MNKINLLPSSAYEESCDHQRLWWINLCDGCADLLGAGCCDAQNGSKENNNQLICIANFQLSYLISVSLQSTPKPHWREVPYKCPLTVAYIKKWRWWLGSHIQSRMTTKVKTFNLNLNLHGIVRFSHYIAAYHVNHYGVEILKELYINFIWWFLW